MTQNPNSISLHLISEASTLPTEFQSLKIFTLNKSFKGFPCIIIQTEGFRIHQDQRESPTLTSCLFIAALIKLVKGNQA